MTIPIERVEPQDQEMPWGTETIIAHTPNYLGKLLRYKAGRAGGLQRHAEKDETFYLYRGMAYVDYDRGDGTLTRVLMYPGESFHIPAGAAHRFEAVYDCVVFEVSTPHFNDRIRMESDYGLPDPGGLPTTIPPEGLWGSTSARYILAHPTSGGVPIPPEGQQSSTSGRSSTSEWA